ncbi:MAG: radical SAM protein, partial [Candidatus Diapherotrites archaeon CG09_land_8_20_14_0_10_32_12]
DWKREVVLGNVKTQSIYEIWNGRKYSKIRRMVNGKIEGPPNFICKRCEAAKS